MIRTRRTATALTAAAALALGVLPAAFTTTSILASDEGRTTVESGAGLQATPDGYVAIERPIGGADRVALYRATGGAVNTQVIQTGLKNCALVTDPVDTGTTALINFDGHFGDSSEAESWAGGSIGVAEKKSGTSCAQVDSPDESLTLTLGTGVTPPTGTPGRLVARSAYMDVELKQNARILATATLGGEVVGYFELQSGSTIGAVDKPAGVTTGIPYAIQTCNNPSDSGPDSGANDNCRWAISNPQGVGSDDGIVFDELSMLAVGGSFSLEYGVDGTVTTGAQAIVPAALAPGASYFELTRIDGIIGCKSTNNTSVTVDGTSTKPEVTVKRLSNAGTETCVPVPYTLKNDIQRAQFLKPVDQQKTSQYVMSMVWTTTTAVATNPESLPPTYANYETGGQDVRLSWCPDPQYNTSGVFTGIKDVLTDNAKKPDQDTTSNRLDPLNPGMPLDGKQFSCILSRSAVVKDGDPDPDKITVTEQIYVLGDILMKK